MNSEFSNKALRRHLVYILLLLIGLIGLLFFYYSLTRPAVSEGTRKQEDFTHLFSIYGFEGDMLNHPSAVAVDQQGRIFIADTMKHRIVVFDGDGQYVTQFGVRGKGKYQLENPIGVAVAPDGRVYVLSKSLKKIVIYNAQFKPIKEIAFDIQPIALTIKNERLYVATRPAIMIGDLDGNRITMFGRWGKAPGEFDMPGGIAVDDNGDIYVADSLNYRVQAFSKDGKPRWQYGKPIPADKALTYRGEDRKFGLPASITMDENGYLYVVDGLSSEIIVLNKQGKFIQKIGDIGQEDGFFYYPEGITYAGGGTMVLADKFNDRVQVFRVPMAVSPAQRYLGSLPYAGLLLLLPLLWLLLRSKMRVVAASDFVDAAAAGANAEAIAKSFKKLYVLPEAYEKIRALLPEKPKLIQKEPAHEEARQLAEAHGLSTEGAAVLALIKGMRGKKVLLVEEPAVRDAAEQLDLVALNYEEFREMTEEEEEGKVEEAVPEVTR